MLEIKTKRRRWPRIVLSVILVAFLALGVYVLLTIFSPTLPVLSGKPTGETTKRLNEPVGTHGDRLYMPQINVDVEIISGGTSSALERGAWHRKPENGDPTKGGNFVLSAHRFVLGYTPQSTVIKSPFYNIGKLQIGDRLFVDYQSKRYEYEVTEKYAIKPAGVDVETPTNDPQLTLYTSTPQGDSDGRDVVEAKLIPTEE